MGLPNADIKATAAQPPQYVKSLRFWGLYAAFWLLLGLSLSLAEYQRYAARGGRIWWEPFLWEISSVAAIGLISPAIYRWVQFLSRRQALSAAVASGHALAAALFSIAHVLLMFGARRLVYTLTGFEYHPGGWLEIFTYETPKDLVTYVTVAGLAYAFVLRERQQQQSMQLARLQGELAEMRLARLQDQLQPHFLFNALNLVSSLMYEDVPRADRMLSELSALLRATMSLDQKITHSLGEELAMLKPFAAIMQARFADRLGMAFHCDESALATEVPCLILLPLVENSIKHGVAQTGGHAEIRVDIRAIEGGVQMRVCSNVGVLERDNREGGIGLSNTRQRLAHTYGARASLVMSAGSPSGVEVTVTVPCAIAPDLGAGK